MRRVTGRDDLWGVGLPLSAEASDTNIGFEQFMQAYEANYVTPEGKLVVDDPEIRRRLIRAMDSYTAIYRSMHPARCRAMGRPREQQGLPCPGGRHGAEHLALDPERPKG